MDQQKQEHVAWSSDDATFCLEPPSPARSSRWDPWLGPRPETPLPVRQVRPFVV
jgi:hypothetical protein